MGKPHPMELWERVVAFVEEGNPHRTTARRFHVSEECANFFSAAGCAKN